MSTQNFGEIFSEVIHRKCIEPQKRMVGGRFGWARHRFPIKGGISWLQTAAKDMEHNNALYRLLTKNKS